ncbi:tryptophan-rich sensory protein [Exiguobacterium sp. s63]|uniref:tryptophan-rich sensory protein n=1 Tax=Exiguobacterium sp. s63 TaxID=2751274 RepID=UPI001BE73405|nr:tryptophan-rich sensory protein [Exiguobacterium sp. s63]
MDLSKWPIVNWVAFLATVVINYFASGDNAAVSDRIDIYFKPAGYAFSIWGVIYVALLVWLVLQLRKGTTANRQAERMKAGFLISCVLNGLWLLAFTNEWFVVSLVIMVSFLATLCWLYYIAFRTSTSWLDRFPFSIYIGWVSVATIVNTFVVMKTEQITSLLGLDELAWTSLMLMVGVIVALLFMWWHHDFIYPLVFVWAYIGIFARIEEGTLYVVIVSALALLAIGYIGLILWKRPKSFLHHPRKTVEQ